MPAVPTSRDPAADAGQIIAGRYEIVAPLGQGALGAVYRAQHVVIGRQVALKLVRPELASDPTWVQSFFTAASEASRLQDEHIAAVLDFGLTADNQPFIVMELLAGRPLREVLAHERLSLRRAIEILRQCCSALATAHAAGVVHRDIKPENIFLLDGAGAPDFARVLDFGAAEPFAPGDENAARAAMVLGTAEYLSPEQAAGRQADQRSDVYSLGVVAYEMLAGRPPFSGPTFLGVAAMHIGTPVPPLSEDVPAELRRIVGRALEKDPSRRYESAGTMWLDCRELAGAATGSRLPSMLDARTTTDMPPPPVWPPQEILPRAPIETIPIETHGLGGAAAAAGLVHWCTRFPNDRIVNHSGTVEVGRTYVLETALETAAEELAIAGAALPADLLPDGTTLRFGLVARGVGVRVAGRGAFSSGADSGEIRFARAQRGTPPVRFELRADAAGPARLTLGLYARNTLLLRTSLDLTADRAGERTSFAAPLPLPPTVASHLLPARPAHVRLEITEQGELQVEIDPARERPREPHQPLAQLADTAIHLRRRLVALSEAYRPDPAAGQFGIQDADKVLFEFARIGAEMHEAFFGPPDGQADADLWRLAGALAAQAEEGGAQPRLQIVADHLPFPWAVMYDGAHAGLRLDAPGDVDVRRFWGARFQIDRSVGANLDGDTPATLSVPVEVRSCLDPQLDAQQELSLVGLQRGQFADMRRVSVAGRIESRDEFVRYLADEGARPCDLLYFFCRARANEPVGAPFFRPGDPPRVQASIALDGGEIDIKTMRELRLKPLPGRPLVFMNACSTADGDQPIQSLFLNHFIGTWRARGFIGTDWKVPVIFADAFARSALRHFLDGGMSIGDAFARAAAESFGQKNPFPLVYALYLRPDLAVSHGS
ncbi:MAG TPA: serine/threonine-protein kinase [Kofleriaceae bacterium]|nr:serine/threonine-protein kinase [Kofleriaceae bacterium]